MVFTTAISLVFTAFGTIIAAESVNNDISPLYHASSRMVLVPVTVTDRNARTIEGLGAKDFAVFDNQIRQEIASFAAEEAPCSVEIVLDVSGSMQGSLSMAKGIAEDILRNADPNDEFQLLTISTHPEAHSGFSSDTAATERTIRAATPGGMTSLLDTVHLGLVHIKQARLPRRVMLILSDGVDNYSRYSEGELMDTALEADVQIYTMIFSGRSSLSSSVLFRPALAEKSWKPAGDHDGSRLLEKLAAKTGGLSYHISNTDDVRQAVNEAEKAMRSEYVIGYRPSMPGDPGAWHRLRVTSNIPKLNVHARNGYFAR